MVVRLFYTSIALVGTVGCGGGSDKKTGGPTGSGMTATATVTPMMGGTVEVEGATLEIPPGAVPGDVEITVTSTTERPPSGFTSWNSPVYQFGPDGLVFLVPVDITLTFTGDPVAPTVMWSLPQGGFENRGGTVSGKNITTTVLHFSEGFVVPAPGPNDPDAGTFVPPDTGPIRDGGNTGGDGGTGGPDGGPKPDGGFDPDGGFNPDAGTPDGGGGGTPDGGPKPDGGFDPDGGVSPDGGPTQDAGPTPDGGGGGTDGGVTPDGGIAPDGGIRPDGGLPGSDGGTPPPNPDGGTAADAGGPPPKDP